MRHQQTHSLVLIGFMLSSSMLYGASLFGCHTTPSTQPTLTLHATWTPQQLRQIKNLSPIPPLPESTTNRYADNP
ncbi:MAG: hypothetical protein AAGJ35_11280, partial [Myxococcota bacterium]